MKFWIFALLFTGFVHAQMEEPIVWETRLEQKSAIDYDLIFEAEIAPKWHLYAQQIDSEADARTEFIFHESGFKRLGPVQESETVTAFDVIFQIDMTYFENNARFTQSVQITDPDLKSISVEVNYQACDDRVCIFRDHVFTFSLDGTATIDSNGLTMDAKSLQKTAALKLNLKNPEQLTDGISKQETKSYWNIFFLGLIGGLLALLTPCVFPMIPLTVSFFIKQTRSGTLNALLYSVFIILIYGMLSLPFHFIDALDPEVLNRIATNVVLNLLFFVVFIVFAFSFFGFYELTLPASWGSKTDAAGQWGGILGIFFMALTLAIVSFSCTGPILGSLLAGSFTSDGGAMQLTAGMLGFGVALGLPFGLFALFPNSLNALPKSGGWMTTLKVVLGFLELALALKFLSNADLVAHWGLLKREVFVGIWLLLAFLLTLYLFGIFRFPHEMKQKISRFRYGFAWLSLVFCSYLFLGLISSENKLKLLSGFPPPDFYSLQSQTSDCPLNLDCYKDFKTGFEMAQVQNKPILLDFTGWACVNCRKMEENVWSDPQVYPILRDEFVIISLYVDDRALLPDDEQFNFQYPDGRIRKIKTIGQQWATFQAVNFQTASQPFYVLMDTQQNLLNAPIQYTGKDTFLNWLKQGKAQQQQ